MKQNLYDQCVKTYTKETLENLKNKFPNKDKYEVWNLAINYFNIESEKIKKSDYEYIAQYENNKDFYFTASSIVEKLISDQIKKDEKEAKEKLESEKTRKTFEELIEEKLTLSPDGYFVYSDDIKDLLKQVRESTKQEIFEMAAEDFGINTASKFMQKIKDLPSDEIKNINQ